jgi:type IV secretory pathway VirB2 component (pilin)
MNILKAAFALYAVSVIPATAQTGGGEPQGSGPILAAVNWIEGTLLGNIATSVAVIAVAITGFMMLSGRVNWRHGITVIIGCFIIFGAAAIVAGIQSAARLAG